MNRRLLIPFAFAIVLFSFYSPESFAQIEPPALQEKFDLKFAGGSAEDFEKSIRALDINLMLPAEADKIEIPPFEVKDVTAIELFLALNILLQGTDETVYSRFEISSRKSATGGIWVLHQQTAAKRNSRYERANLELEYNLIPINISNLLEFYTIEDITSVIQSAVETYAGAVDKVDELKLDIKFHRETGILILSGPHGAVKLAQTTMNELRPVKEDKE